MNRSNLFAPPRRCWGSWAQRPARVTASLSCPARRSSRNRPSPGFGRREKGCGSPRRSQMGLVDTSDASFTAGRGGGRRMAGTERAPGTRGRVSRGPGRARGRRRLVFPSSEADLLQRLPRPASPPSASRESAFALPSFFINPGVHALRGNGVHRARCCKRFPRDVFPSLLQPLPMQAQSGQALTRGAGRL